MHWRGNNKQRRDMNSPDSGPGSPRLRDSLKSTTRIWIAKRLIYSASRIADLAARIAPEVDTKPFCKTTIWKAPGNDA